jgi:hypothetical protein
LNPLRHDFAEKGGFATTKSKVFSPPVGARKKGFARVLRPPGAISAVGALWRIMFIFARAVVATSISCP